MSTKQFISAEKHLAKLGVTVEQAFNFIFANVNQPEIIFTAARQHGVTKSMLHEITGVSDSVINDYFKNAGLVPERLDHTSILFNTDIGSFESLVGFNENIGALSNASLGAKVQPLVDFPSEYNFPFTDRYDFQSEDKIYDADELGISQLGNIAATDENIKSIFYGTLIRMFSRLDSTELSQISGFPKNGNPEDFQTLLLDTLNDPITDPTWTEESLVNKVVDEAVYLHNHYMQDDFVVGLFDHSYLGYAPVIH
ncbi:MAG: hypothetical protein HRU77_09180 [Gammaproteobacteria bacterium]|nr:MAG: hypothetical protein HRU77_09180 [Gammaproteobacteria bacterium]